MTVLSFHHHVKQLFYMTDGMKFRIAMEKLSRMMVGKMTEYGEVDGARGGSRSPEVFVERLTL